MDDRLIEIPDRVLDLSSLLLVLQQHQRRLSRSFSVTMGTPGQRSACCAFFFHRLPQTGQCQRWVSSLRAVGYGKIRFALG
ncbi:MAG: hypothetical protein SFW36_14895 [Leptolyngbyaceae cyanobacterium bins.59]|nr:hypothetical protein [Leptolyngbyaceae cyanobacterium bins.59]